ncbi:ATP synthase [Thioclava dalianensis]|uniref:ATP synthase n=1 Tax=Thioclava dalianensis TaxID=1185766 RepID=A0A074TLF6_9RHOB|nr:H-type lectin domain-containing protein [Thioclava dalianensis]KEP71015.1 ATP synthase [Thioclava dalianensis]SFN26861.1 H-type lectin domain-containing protein [Thioclava dalianensis]
MITIESHRVGLQQGSMVLFSDYQDGGAMWTGDGPRELRKLVEFPTAFRETPMVHVALSMWDIDQKHNGRMDISAEMVTSEGFVVVFRTWGDSRVARVRADWLAIGAVGHDDDWDIQ